MKTAGKVFIIIYRILASAVVLAAVAILILFICGIRPYAVRTGSMEPTIPQGSLSFVNTRAAFSDIKERDIIAFQVGDVFVTHRAVGIDGGSVTTQGDANNNTDAAKVTENNYIGETLFWVPVVGWIPLYAHTAGGRIVVIGGFALFVLSGVIYDRVSAYYSNKNKDGSET